MAAGRSPVNLVAILFGLILGLIVGSLWMRRRKQPYLAATEYWVYMPGTELPAQQDVMHRMLAANPYGRPSDPPIGPREGVMFSDIRLHIALVLRSKNPQAFRPDLFSEDVEPGSEQIATMTSSNSLAKIRFISEQPVPDKRHITFLVHAADAMAELGSSNLIYDLVTERLLDREELVGALRADPTGTDPALHVRVLWKRTPWGGQSETRGLRKVGASDLVSAEMEGDERVLVSEVVEEAAKTIWNEGIVPEPFQVQAFDDLFQIRTLRPKDGRMAIRILRVQTA